MSDATQFREIVLSFGGKLSKPKADFRESLKAHGLSEAAIDLVVSHALKKQLEIGPMTFYSDKGVLSVNSADAIPVAIRDGLLIIGTCYNGDPVAMDVRDNIGAVGFIGHETMWQEKSVRSVFIPLAQSLGELLASVDDDDFPSDYYDAESQNRTA